MKLLTNSDNVDGLKIVISAYEANVSLQIELQGEGILPCFIDEKYDLKLFVANSACLYLHENVGLLKKKAIGAVDDLLKWETTILRPLLNTFQSTKKNAEEIKAALKSKILPILETKNEHQLTHYPQNSQVVAISDIVIWCDLYPIYVEQPDIFDNTLPRLKSWMDHLASLPNFKKGLENVIRSKGNRIKWNYSTWSKKSLSFDVQTSKKGIQDSSSKPLESQASDTSKEVPISKEELQLTLKAWNSPLNKLKKKDQKEKVLPIKGERNVLITSALPYVNNVPHLGNIVGCVLSADVFARFCRLRGYNTLYVCGTDEYGTSTETKAIEEGLTPQQICDKYNALHTEIYQWFGIGFDEFGRTTTEKQTKIAQDIFWDLHKAGNLMEDSMDQLFCQSCDRFLADRFVEGQCPFCNFEDARGDQCDGCGKLINAIELKQPRCKLCNATPQVKTSKHIFINLPNVESELNTWLEESSKDWSSNARVIAKSWLRGGLQPRCITRDLKWGTPVPMEGYESKVFYVWFDAPIGYISITANYTDDWEQWWKNPDEVTYYEFMAKDNVPFHSVVFPSTLIGTKNKWSLVNHLMSTEYLNYEDAKFSKSRGIGVFGNDAIETGIPADIWRFYLMYTRPENADSAFKWEDLMFKTNSELLANLGNFVNRALKFNKDNFDGLLGKITLTSNDEQILAQINRCLKNYVDLLEKCKEREAFSQILNISRIGNKLMQDEKPWKLVKSKDENERSRAKSVVSLCVNISCLLAVLIEPYMPNLSKVLLEQLNAKLEDVNVLEQPDEEQRLFRCFLKEGHTIGQPAPLIKEIKPDEIKAFKQRYAGRTKSSSPPKTVEKNETVNNSSNETTTKQLESAVAIQADVVRKAKAEKKDKGIIDVEVKKLLELKKQLLIAQGKDPNENVNSGKKGKKK